MSRRRRHVQLELVEMLEDPTRRWSARAVRWASSCLSRSLFESDVTRRARLAELVSRTPPPPTIQLTAESMASLNAWADARDALANSPALRELESRAYVFEAAIGGLA